MRHRELTRLRFPVLRARCWCPLSSLPLFAGRVGKHCQDRWNTKLGLDHSVWAEEEYRILSDAHAALGKDWQGIAALLPGRTGQQVKAYFDRYPSTEAAASENASRSAAQAPPLRRKRKSNPASKLGGNRMKRLKPAWDARTAEVAAAPRQVLADSTNGQASPISVVSVVSDIAFQKLPIRLHTAVAVNQGHQQCTPPRPDRHCIPTDTPQRAPNRAQSAPRNLTPDGKAAVESLAEFGNFDIIFDIIFGSQSRISRAPCGMLYLVPMFIAC